MKKQSYLLVLLLLLLGSCSHEKEQVFKPTVKSLQQYETPEWFGKAKFGIWVCWNPYAYTAVGDWYARNMYIQGSPQYEYHLKTYGHPSKYGYKDIIQDWKGEDFNAQQLVDLFVEVGAKYIVGMANHHDNYDLWDSKYHAWNSVNYGPHRDVIGELYNATKKYEDQGIRWGVTSHVERAISWFQTNKGADKTGPYAGVPYDGNDPKYQDLYLPPNLDGDMKPTQPSNAPEFWKENWLLRCKDLIEKYDPDFFYVDGGVPFPGEDRGKTGLEMISYLYNQSIKRNGKNEAVMAIKNWYIRAPKGEWGYYWDGIATLNLERARLPKIRKKPWQTDTSIGDWTYVEGGEYRSASEIIQELIDIVSKNGNMLLNVSPMGNGQLDNKAYNLLKEIGAWMKINGESIYETKPWLTSGVGSCRFVTKGDTTIYMSLLAKAKDKHVSVPYLASKKGESLGISSIKILGYEDEKIDWSSTSAGLEIEIPTGIEFKHAMVFRIEGDGFDKVDEKPIKALYDRTEELKVWFGKQKTTKLGEKYISVSAGSQGYAWAINKSNDLLELKDGKVSDLGIKAKDVGASASGVVYVALDGSVYLHTFHPLMWVDFPEGDDRITLKSKDGKEWLKLPGIVAERCDIIQTGTVWVIDENAKVNYYDDRMWKCLDKKADDIACGGAWLPGIAVLREGELNRFDGTCWTKLGGKNLKTLDVSIQDKIIVCLGEDGRLSLFDLMGSVTLNLEAPYQDVSCGANDALILCGSE